MTATRTFLFAASILSLTSTAWAQGMPGMQRGGMQGGRMGPPPEAREACTGKSQGAACSFQAPHGRLSGTCNMPPIGGQALLCMPGGPAGPGGQMGSPQMGSQIGQQQQQQMGGQQPSRTMRRGPGSGAQGGQQNFRPRGADIDAKFSGAKTVTSRVPDTQQGSCFNTGAKTDCPSEGHHLYGQDAHYHGTPPSYTDNADGTITDNVTGLLWEKAHHAKRIGYGEAKNACSNLRLGGRSDWRLPNIKELFSLSDFRGSQKRRFFIDDVFDLEEPDASVLEGDRFAATHSTQMMGQTWSSTIYTGVHYGRPGVEAAFFYNFLDGHIKQAPTRGKNGLFYRCVSGAKWGANDFVDNNDGTVTDRAMGLTWQQSDDGQTRDWLGALQYCEGLSLGGKTDWRLPNVKELQTIVDYKKNDPALDQRYLKQSDKKAWFWSSTTHGDNISMASYVCFGKCVSSQGVDTHGAGAQRSDPKTGNPSRWSSLGGQEDEVRIQNAVRCVR